MQAKEALLDAYKNGNDLGGLNISGVDLDSSLNKSLLSRQDSFKAFGVKKIESAD